MAAFRARLGSVLIEIYDVDHGPAHCHVSGLPRGLRVRVDLYTLQVVKPPGTRLPSRVKRHLVEIQIEMLTAWENVTSSDRGDSGEHGE